VRCPRNRVNSTQQVSNLFVGQLGSQVEDSLRSRDGDDKSIGRHTRCNKAPHQLRAQRLLLNKDFKNSVGSGFRLFNINRQCLMLSEQSIRVLLALQGDHRDVAP
jgi:hypothetical protein